MSYSAEFFDDIEEHARRSASVIVPMVQALVAVDSVLDVGCGTGAWLKAWQDAGVTRVLGLDGDYVDRGMLEIDPADFRPVDLTSGDWGLEGWFDLVMSLEVAEHLPAGAAGGFVRQITARGDVVLFSAALPGQGGEHHVNEQPPDYWRDLFASHGFAQVDPIRERVWQDDHVAWWYAQNTFLYVRDDRLAGSPELQAATRASAFAGRWVVHPRGFADSLDAAIGRTYDRARQQSTPASIVRKAVAKVRRGMRSR